MNNRNIAENKVKSTQMANQVRNQNQLSQPNLNKPIRRSRNSVDSKTLLFSIVDIQFDKLKVNIIPFKNASSKEIFDTLLKDTIVFQESDEIIDLQKIFDLNLDGEVSMFEFINSFRSKMTGLDPHNMNLIENSLKKAFRNLFKPDKNLIAPKRSDQHQEKKLSPAQFTKICIPLMWFFEVYKLFRQIDTAKVSKISLMDLKQSVLFYLIEGDDMQEKFAKFDFHPQRTHKQDKSIDSTISTKMISFNQVFSLVEKTSEKFINFIEKNQKEIVFLTIEKVRSQPRKDNSELNLEDVRMNLEPQLDLDNDSENYNLESPRSSIVSKTPRLRANTFHNLNSSKRRISYNVNNQSRSVNCEFEQTNYSLNSSKSMLLVNQSSKSFELNRSNEKENIQHQLQKVQFDQINFDQSKKLKNDFNYVYNKIIQNKKLQNLKIIQQKIKNQKYNDIKYNQIKTKISNKYNLNYKSKYEQKYINQTYEKSKIYNNNQNYIDMSLQKNKEKSAYTYNSASVSLNKNIYPKPEYLSVEISNKNFMQEQKSTNSTQNYPLHEQQNSQISINENMNYSNPNHTKYEQDYSSYIIIPIVNNKMSIISTNYDYVYSFINNFREKLSESVIHETCTRNRAIGEDISQMRSSQSQNVKIPNLNLSFPKRDRQDVEEQIDLDSQRDEKKLEEKRRRMEEIQEHIEYINDTAMVREESVKDKDSHVNQSQVSSYDNQAERVDNIYYNNYSKVRKSMVIVEEFEDFQEFLFDSISENIFLNSVKDALIGFIHQIAFTNVFLTNQDIESKQQNQDLISKVTEFEDKQKWIVDSLVDNRIYLCNFIKNQNKSLESGLDLICASPSNMSRNVSDTDQMDCSKFDNDFKKIINQITERNFRDEIFHLQFEDKINQIHSHEAQQQQLLQHISLLSNQTIQLKSDKEKIENSLQVKLFEFYKKYEMLLNTINDRKIRNKQRYQTSNLSKKCYLQNYQQENITLHLDIKMNNRDYQFEPMNEDNLTTRSKTIEDVTALKIELKAGSLHKEKQNSIYDDQSTQIEIEDLKEKQRKLKKEYTNLLQEYKKIQDYHSKRKLKKSNIDESRLANKHRKN